MNERQPSTREIRLVLEELMIDTLPPDDTEMAQAQAQNKLLRALADRFPKLTAGVLSQALEISDGVIRRRMARDKLKLQRVQAYADFLGQKMYANFDEAADDLGLLSDQEVWDLVMDKAGLPPCNVPETLDEMT